MTVRIGVVGTGRWAAQHHIPAVLADPRAELVALCESRPDKLAEAAGRFGVPRTFTDVEPLVAAGLVDALVIATPPAHHHAAAALALDAGLHVLVEKPFTIDPAHAWDLVRRAERAGRHLVVGLTFQFTPHAEMARELVAGLGELLLVSVLYSSAMAHLYKGTWGDPAADRFARPEPETFSDPALAGGGQGHNQLSHALGCVLGATDLPVRSVRALTRGAPLDLTDALLLEFAGQAVGTVASTGTLRPGQPAQWELRYYGERGLVLQDLARGTLAAHPHGGPPITPAALPPDAVYPTRAPVHRLVDLVLGSTRNPAPGALGARVTDVVAAAYRSADRGGSAVAPGGEP